MNTSIEDIVKVEEERRKEFEARTVVTEQGETIADLRKVFEAVCDAKDWKAPWAAAVPSRLVGIVIRAVQFFHADTPTTEGIQLITGKVLMSGKGYQAY